MNRSRVQKARQVSDFLRNLPEGVTHIKSKDNPEAQESQVAIEDQLSYEFDPDAKDSDIVRVGDFMINIEKVTKAAIISMRKFLPTDEYRLLKNRKSARLCRRKRKEERGDMQKTIDSL